MLAMLLLVEQLGQGIRNLALGRLLTGPGVVNIACQLEGMGFQDKAAFPQDFDKRVHQMQDHLVNVAYQQRFGVRLSAGLA